MVVRASVEWSGHDAHQRCGRKAEDQAARHGLFLWCRVAARTRSRVGSVFNNSP
jgi:hypothetical protein